MKLTKTKLKQIIKETISLDVEYLDSIGSQEMADAKRAAGDPKRARPPKRESVEGIDPDEMTHGEYFVHSGGPVGMEAELDEFSVAIGAARDAGVEPKDILAFVQQVLGDAQSNQVIDV